jgi:hypothetical protein
MKSAKLPAGTRAAVIALILGITLAARSEAKMTPQDSATQEQTLQQVQRELEIVKTELALRDRQVQFMADQLAKRESSLKFHRAMSFGGLAVGAVMFLVGYFSLRAGKKRRARLAALEA